MLRVRLGVETGSGGPSPAGPLYSNPALCGTARSSVPSVADGYPHGNPRTVSLRW